ncbi:MAG: histone H1 [Clostridia bacterium]|nr:histone H1 [Clostridia bacterium]
MKELINHISELAEKFKSDATAQATNGNKAAGLRARRVSLELEPLLKQFRKLSLEESKK